MCVTWVLPAHAVFVAVKRAQSSRASCATAVCVPHACYVCQGARSIYMFVTC
jgi:hypothetical protein